MINKEYWAEPSKSEVPCQICKEVGWSDWILLPHKLFNSLIVDEKAFLCFPCFLKRANEKINPTHE